MKDHQPLLIRGGRVLGRHHDQTATRDLAIAGGVFVPPAELPEGHAVQDARGLIVAPGLIDMHVHLREPGFEHKETLETGATSAVHGGFTTICAMPNTNPPIDTVEAVLRNEQRAREAGMARIHQYAAVTLGQRGETLVDFEALSAAGVVAFSDDGVPVRSPERMNAALRRLVTLGHPVLVHAEEVSLSPGPITTGPVARRLGVDGIDPLAEELMILRDAFLAEATGAKVHMCHVSTARGAELIRRAKAAGAPVTAELCMHHLLLTDGDVGDGDPFMKVNPPLRTEADCRGLTDALIDGTIDAIASDHAPHADTEKARGLVEAPFGFVGLETTLPLVLTHLVRPGLMTLEEAIARMTTVPAEILGLPTGRIADGAPGDLAIIDPEVCWEIDRERLHSKSKNTPYHGWTVYGRAVATVVGGQLHRVA